MQYPEKEIYTELVTRLKAHDYYFTAEGHTPPAHYDWDREQYTDAAEVKEYPFNRPAVFFRFGEMEYQGTSGFSQKGTVPLEVVVVQDKFVDAGDGAANQSDYLKLLEYKYLINNVLNLFQGTCFRSLVMTSIETDHDNRNLHVERIRYTIGVSLVREVIPPEA